MDPKKVERSRLETLPQDLLGIIVSKVGATSSEDFHNCILSCKELGASANDERVLQKLNLAPLVKKPLLSIQYLPLMKKCLANNNPDAHFIKGMIRYFLLNDHVIGLHHLGVAAHAGKLEAVYLYAIILLCSGRIVEGKIYLNKLKWTEDTTMVDTCWKNIKASLHGIRVPRKRCYFISLQQMKPTSFCHLKDMDTTCEKCFYYKQMYKFIFMI